MNLPENKVIANLHKLELNRQYLYRDICDILEIPFTRNDSRLSQIRKLSKFLTLINEGRFYIVTGVNQKIINDVKLHDQYKLHDQDSQSPKSSADAKAISSADAEVKSSVEDEFETEAEFKNLSLMTVTADNGFTYTANRDIMANISSFIKEGDLLPARQLIETVGLPYNSSGHNTSSLKELQRYVDLKKIGSKYLIREIYETPLPPVGRKLRKDSKYTKYLALILLSILNSEKDGVMVKTKMDWWTAVGLVNNRFALIKNDEKERKRLMEEHPELKEEDINEFYNRAYPKLNKIFDSALKNLEKRFLAIANKIYLAIDEEGNCIVISNENTIKRILNMERAVLINQGFESIEQLFFRDIKTQMKYYEELNEHVRENFGYCKIFRAIKLIYNQQDTSYAVEKDKEKINRTMQELNTEIVNWAIKNIATRKINFINKMDAAAEDLENEDKEVANKASVTFFDERNNKKLNELYGNDCYSDNQLFMIGKAIMVTDVSVVNGVAVVEEVK